MNFKNRHLREITLIDATVIPSMGEDDSDSLAITFMLDESKYCQQVAGTGGLRYFENKKTIAYFQNPTAPRSIKAFICVQSGVVVGVANIAATIVLGALSIALTYFETLDAIQDESLLKYAASAILIGTLIYQFPKFFQDFKIYRSLKQALKHYEKNRP